MTSMNIFNELLKLMQLRKGQVPRIETNYSWSIPPEIIQHLPDDLKKLFEEKAPCAELKEKELEPIGILDLLGVYLPAKRQVIIYDLLIRLCAGEQGIPYQILYDIVVCHELAHAATHLGIDQNGEIWALFGSEPAAIKEYFAQIYTYIYYNQSQRNVVTGAMAKFARTQPSIYQKYLDDTGENISDINRALLQARHSVPALQSSQQNIPGAGQSATLQAPQQITPGTKPKSKNQRRLLVTYHLANELPDIKHHVQILHISDKKNYIEIPLWGKKYRDNVPVTELIPLAVVTCACRGTYDYQGVMYDLEDIGLNDLDLLPFAQKYNGFYVITLKLSDIHVDVDKIKLCETHNSSPLLNPIGRIRARRILVSKAQDADFVAYLKKPGTLTEYYKS